MKKAALALGFLLTTCAPAHAQKCGSPFGFISAMQDGGFNMVASGDIPQGYTMQTWATESGQYVVVIVFPDGMVCLAFEGVGYEAKMEGGDL